MLWVFKKRFDILVPHRPRGIVFDHRGCRFSHNLPWPCADRGRSVLKTSLKACHRHSTKQGWNFIFSFGIFAVRQILESNTVNVSVLCKCWVKNNQIFSLFMCTLLVRFKFHIQGRYTSVWREVAVRIQTFHKLHTWWLIHFLASFFSSAHWPRRNTPF